MPSARPVYRMNHKLSGVKSGAKAQPLCQETFTQFLHLTEVYLECSAGTSSFNSLQSLELTEKEREAHLVLIETRHEANGGQQD